MYHSRDRVENVPVEVGVVHDRRMATLHARSPLGPEPVIKALAVAPLTAALVERMRVEPQEAHQGIQLAHLEEAFSGSPGTGNGVARTEDETVY